VDRVFQLMSICERKCCYLDRKLKWRHKTWLTVVIIDRAGGGVIVLLVFFFWAELGFELRALPLLSTP
jgi:hypothetical protein